MLVGVTVGITLAATQTAEVEVRINARQLDDGRVEFALQQRDGSGWSERIAPRGRYFPADPGHSRWLNSTPVVVTAELEEEAQSTTSMGESDRAQYGVETVGLSEDGRILHFHGDAGVNGQRTVLRIFGTANDSLYDESRVSFICDHDIQSLWVSVDVGTTIGDDWHPALLDDYDGYASAAFGTLSQQVWKSYGLVTYDDDVQIDSSNGEGKIFFVTALNHRWLSVNLPTYSGSITATFDLQDAFNTPIQWMLFNCSSVTR